MHNCADRHQSGNAAARADERRLGVRLDEPVQGCTAEAGGMSEGEQLATILFAGAGAAFVAGNVFAETSDDGTRRFNGNAALGFGLGATLLALALT